MTPVTEYVSERDSVIQAVRKMVALGMHSIVVLEQGGTRIKGTLNNRHVVELLSRGGAPEATTAGEICRDVESLRSDAPLGEIVTSFSQGGAQRAVTDASGTLLGVIGVQDLDAYLRTREELGEDAEVVSEISSGDRDSLLGRGVSLVAALSALRCIRTALKETGKETVTSILDFPCGHGRIIRVLKAAFPDARLAAGDLDRDAVDFCASAFGATPVYSDEDPAKVRIDGTFDLVWCGSLLTHLDAHRWRGFLELFQTSLARRGLLVFTTHGQRDRATLRHFGLREHQIDTIVADFEASGFGYVDYEGRKGLGIALATPEWVRRQVEHVPGLRLVSYVEAGWNAPAPRQDVFSCVGTG